MTTTPDIRDLVKRLRARTVEHRAKELRRYYERREVYGWGTIADAADMLDDFAIAAAALEQLLEAVEEAERERFKPTGDNHHNAFACPYCNPTGMTPADLAGARKVVRDARALLAAHTKITITEYEQKVIGDLDALIAKHGASND